MKRILMAILIAGCGTDVAEYPAADASSPDVMLDADAPDTADAGIVVVDSGSIMPADADVDTPDAAMPPDSSTIKCDDLVTAKAVIDVYNGYCVCDDHTCPQEVGCTSTSMASASRTAMLIGSGEAHERSGPGCTSIGVKQELAGYEWKILSGDAMLQPSSPVIKTVPNVKLSISYSFTTQNVVVQLVTISKNGHRSNPVKLTIDTKN